MQVRLAEFTVRHARQSSFCEGGRRTFFGLSFDVLLYDLTSTYFESEPPANPEGKRRFGYSRDKRSDCVQVSLGHQLRAKAPGLTVRQLLEKFSRMQMMDVHFPTTDGRELVFRRYTQPEPDQQLLLAQMNWELPPQAPPRITAKGELENGCRPSGCPA